MSSQSIKHKATSGMFWTGFQKVGSMVISFGANMLLARLLSPSDFGCIGMILVFINLSSVFIDAGFGSALIQKKNTTEIDFSTIFYWNILVSIILYFLLFVLSSSIAEFYRIEKLESILPVLGLVLIFNAFSLVQTTKLKIQLNFKLLANCFMIATIVAVVVTVLLAFKGYGVWSLVAFQLLQSGLNTILLWIVTKWKPLPVFSWSSFIRLFKFGIFLLMSSLFTTLCNQIQSLFIGKICNTATLGYYSQAKNMENAPTNVIYSVVGQVVYPIFSENQHDLSRLSELCMRFMACVAFISFPLMFLLIIMAKPLIVLLLSSEWIPSVPYFQILCVAGMATTLIDICNYAVASTGHSKEIFIWSAIKNLIGIGLISLGTLWNIYGILAGVVLYAYLGLGVYSILMKKIIKFDYYDQFKNLIPILLTCIVAFTINYVLCYLFDINYFFRGSIFVILYLLICVIFRFNSGLWVKEASLTLIEKFWIKNEEE